MQPVVQVIKTTLQVAIVNVLPSDYSIATVYAIIAAPPFAGASQVILTSVPEIAVTGAPGTIGGKFIGVAKKFIT